MNPSIVPLPIPGGRVARGSSALSDRVPDVRPYRSRKRNESALLYLCMAMFDRLGVIPNLNYSVRCPINADHRASVMFRHYLRTGRVVLYCSDGCTEAEVLASLGLRRDDLQDCRRSPVARATRRRHA